MKAAAFDRDRYSPGAYIEEALRRQGGIFKALRMSHVLTPMSLHGYVQQSELCHRIAAYVGPSFAAGSAVMGQTFAYLRGLDGAYKVAREVHLLADMRFAMQPEFGPDGIHLEGVTENPTSQQIDQLINEANEYYFSSEMAMHIGATAVDHLAAAPKYRPAVSTGFTTGLMLAHYGAMEALHDATESPEIMRQAAGVAALCQPWHGDGTEASL